MLLTSTSDQSLESALFPESYRFAHCAVGKDDLERLITSINQTIDSKGVVTLQGITRGFKSLYKEDSYTLPAVDIDPKLETFFPFFKKLYTNSGTNLDTHTPIGPLPQLFETQLSKTAFLYRLLETSGILQEIAGLSFNKAKDKVTKHFQGKNILEIGPGYGEESRLLKKAGANVTMLDPFPTEFIYDLQRSGARLIKEQLQDTSHLFPINSFDLIFGKNVFCESVFDREEVLSSLPDIFSSLKEGGVFMSHLYFAPTPAIANFYSQWAVQVAIDAQTSEEKIKEYIAHYLNCSQEQRAIKNYANLNILFREDLLSVGFSEATLCLSDNWLTLIGRK